MFLALAKPPVFSTSSSMHHLLRFLYANTLRLPVIFLITELQGSSQRQILAPWCSINLGSVSKWKLCTRTVRLRARESSASILSGQRTSICFGILIVSYLFSMTQISAELAHVAISRNYFPRRSSDRVDSNTDLGSCRMTVDLPAGLYFYAIHFQGNNIQTYSELRAQIHTFRK